jgi:hypothetical protein
MRLLGIETGMAVPADDGYLVELAGAVVRDFAP